MYNALYSVTPALIRIDIELIDFYIMRKKYVGIKKNVAGVFYERCFGGLEIYNKLMFTYLISSTSSSTYFFVSV